LELKIGFADVSKFPKAANDDSPDHGTIIARCFKLPTTVFCKTLLAPVGSL
jgi:hypothetical protein